MRHSRALLTVLAVMGAAPLAAQTARVITPGPAHIMLTSAGGDDRRAMLGISTSSGSARDTLGVLISGITAGGPAEKAGFSEGDRIQSINGVSLRVSRDDAGDQELGGIMQRRLTRELGKTKAGEEVTLQVWRDGASKSYKVTTIAADELLRPARAKASGGDRAVIGIAFGLTGSKRDTAGIFVNSVTEDGPAEKAGIVEGDRISAVNGISLKTSKDDLEDEWAANSRLTRLSREVAKAKPGDVMELSLVSAGRTRSVKVTTAKASSLKGYDDGGSFTFFRSPDAPMPPLAPMAPMAAMPPMPPMPLMMAPDVMQEMHAGLDQARQQLQAARIKLGARTIRM